MSDDDLARLAESGAAAPLLVAPDGCPECGQQDVGQYGEYPCPSCGLPREWDPVGGCGSGAGCAA